MLLHRHMRMKITRPVLQNAPRLDGKASCRVQVQLMLISDRYDTFLSTNRGSISDIGAILCIHRTGCLGAAISAPGRSGPSLFGVSHFGA
uniref:Uncharacterized protein n=1 Tax=Romanomermis culicivorax TaxID=13658 RepID=A0A915IUL5_ROMCU